MDGFNILNVSDYQRRLDILANITPFRPGMFLKANDERLLKEVFDGQIEISEIELKTWAERHSEDSRGEIRCRVVGANPLTVKILDYGVDHEEQVLKEKNRRNTEWKRNAERRCYP